MTRSYELMLLLSPTAEVSEKSAMEAVEKVVGGQSKVADITLLGKKELAYPINKQTQGVYVLAKLSGGPVSVHEIEKKIQMGGSVMRFLLISVN